VQGITPPQAAPMKIEKAEEDKPSFIGKLFGWFKSLGAEEQPEAKPSAGKPRNAPNRGRGGERNEGGNKRRERGARPERSEGGGNRDRSNLKQAQPEAAAKPQEPREPRQPKQPRTPRVSEEKPALESKAAIPAKAVPTDAHPSGNLDAGSNVAAEQSGEGGAREGGRRRGRRGGQRERQRRDNIAQNTETPANNGGAAPAGQTIAQTSAAPAIVKPTEYIAFPDGYVSTKVTPSEYIAMPTIATQQNVAPAAVVNEVAQPVVAPVAAAPTAAPAAATTSSSEGLVQIETDPSKFSTVVTPPPAQPPIRRRSRQREVYVENEPLLQVETHRPQA